MIRLGRVSKETKGIEKPSRVEDLQSCQLGEYFVRPANCPA